MAFYRTWFIRLLVLSIVAPLGPLVATAAGAATVVTVINLDDPGEGFNDPTPVAPIGGNAGTTVGAQRLNAFQHAANIWAERLASAVEIRIGARFDPLFCDAASAVLGTAGPAFVARDFTGAPVPNTWYPIALANAIFGSDLSAAVNDITATFNSALGTPACSAFPAGWYYGLDGNPGTDLDFVTAAAHELAHGLGFTTFMDLGTGAKLFGSSDIFMHHLERHGATPADFPSMTDAQRLAAITDTGNLHWVGPHVQAASGGLTAGKVGDHVRMFAPNPMQPTMSVLHWDTALTPDQLLEPSYTGPLHDPVLELPLFEDIGWTLAGACSYAINPTTATSPATGGPGTVTVTTTSGCDWTATSNVPWITTSSVGNGSGTASYSVAANGGAARTGTLTIAGKTFTVEQAALNPCAEPPGCGLTNGVSIAGLSGARTSQNYYYIDVPPGASFPLAVQTSGGTGDVDLYVRFGQAPTLTAYDCRPWVSRNNETCNFTTVRTGRWFIMLRGFAAYSGVTLRAQHGTAPPPACSYTIAPVSASYPAAASTGNEVQVTAQAGCAWTATSSAGWVTITGGNSGSGNGTVTYSVGLNTGAARTGTLTIATRAFTVQQAEALEDCAVAPGCKLTNGVAATGIVGSLESQSYYYIDVPTGMGSLTVQTTGGTGNADLYVLFGQTPTLGGFDCRPALGGNDELCTFTFPPAGRWQIMLRGVAAYSGLSLKAQHAPTTPCTYAINPTTASSPAAGGSGNVAVTTAAGCTWTATSNVAWITITSGSSGTGNGTVNYTVAANSGAARSGTLTIAGKTFTVQQADGTTPSCTTPPGCTLTNGVAVAGLAGAQGSQSYYYIDVPAGATSLTIQTSGGTGDVDLYVRLAQAPTLTTYACRPWLSRNNETCTFNPVVAGRWYIMLRGYAAYNGVTLKAQY